MPLSEHEQRLLSQMEEQLLSDDPRFASAMSGSTASISAGRLALGVVGVVVGLGVLLGGVATNQWIVGVLGFALMLAAAVYGFLGVGGARKKSEAKLTIVGQDGRKRAPHPAARKKRSGSLTERMEMRWQQRRERGEF